LKQCPVCSGCALEAAGCPAQTTTSVQVVAQTTSTTFALFDCNADFQHWHLAWAEAKADWCCQHANRGCSSAPPSTSTHSVTMPPAHFDCQAGYSNWEAGWAPAKKSWCCQHVGRGCQHPVRTVPSTTTSSMARPTTPQSTTLAPMASMPFNCDEAHANHELEWSQAKHTWCCTNLGRGCSTTSQVFKNIASSTTSANSPPFDCGAALSNWEAAWSDAKKSWCCVHTSLGCSTTTTPAQTSHPFDCNAAAANWRATWSAAKKDWCCKSVSLGCVTEQTTLLDFDCHAAVYNWKAAWSDAKKAWCCEHAGHGCQISTTRSAAHPTASIPFDCDAGYATRETAWSPAKQNWCCNNLGRGCGPTGTAVPASPSTSTIEQTTHIEAHMPFDCVEAQVAEWAADEATWCCSNLGRGCAKPFNCSAGLSNWIHGWSPSKKRWCCEHEAKGCDPPSAFARSGGQKMEGLSVKYERSVQEVLPAKMGVMQVCFTCGMILSLGLSLSTMSGRTRTWINRTYRNLRWRHSEADLQLTENNAELVRILS